MRINKEWHRKHRMPADASPEERIKWHRKHAKKCGCRPMPKKLLNKIKE